MAIASMTGFAREAGTTGPFQWAWEIKSVNGRGLDIRARVPPSYDAVAEEARKLLSQKLSRGTCQLGLSVTRAATSPRVKVNREVLAALTEALGSLPPSENIRPASLDGLLAVRGVVEIDEEADDPAAAALLQADLLAAAGRLAEALDAARRDEGRALHDTIAGQIAAIETLVQRAETHPGRQPDAIRARLASLIAQLVDASTGLDPARLHQEAVLVATRADVREELDRLAAHIASARELLASGTAVGRRLDFLAQEFGREANTLCAKANDVELSRLGLELKAVVEQFREQVQNVE
ncbi:MAG TPA: YicC/YloC family endoribonuclease [Beijerinckiaceae bacterium]|jgi:uncharacterized protein (TIGR00255 family)